MFSVSHQQPWRNWGRTEWAIPQSVVAPRGVDDVVDTVRAARRDKRTVKAVGAGHSFTGIAVADGIQLNLSNMRGLISVDVERSRATFAAGTHLHEIPALLQPYGLAMANLGDIDAQTLAGATSTGTHGTGIGFGGIATQIVGVTLVNGVGELLTVTEDEPELLQAVALGLGALGILVEITLQCVPTFALQAVETPEDLDDTVNGFLSNVAAHDHYEFYWFPHTTLALTKTNTRMPADTPASGPSQFRRYLDDELLSNKVFGALCYLGAYAPQTIPTIARTATSLLSPRTIVGQSASVFASSRTVHFREMEWAIPLESVPDAFREVKDLIEHTGLQVSFPIEVRAAAADDLMLSTASGRDTGYLAVHRYHRDRDQSYFDGVERIMTSYGGRPHWGKMHSRTARDFVDLYPRFGEFIDVRNKLDPDRLFHNSYLDTVLGR